MESSVSGLSLYNGTFTDSGEESAQVRSAPVSALPLLQTPAMYSEVRSAPACGTVPRLQTPASTLPLQTPAPNTELRHTPSHYSEVLHVLHPTCNLLHTTVRLALLLRANAYHTPPPPLLQGSEHACTLYTTPASEG